MIAMLGEVLALTGLKTSNVADAPAVYWIVSWQATQDNNNDLEPVPPAPCERR